MKDIILIIDSRFKIKYIIKVSLRTYTYYAQ